MSPMFNVSIRVGGGENYHVYRYGLYHFLGVFFQAGTKFLGCHIYLDHEYILKITLYGIEFDLIHTLSKFQIFTMLGYLF